MNCNKYEEWLIKKIKTKRLLNMKETMKQVTLKNEIMVVKR